jgi:hypothetical protein
MRPKLLPDRNALYLSCANTGFPLRAVRPPGRMCPKSGLICRGRLEFFR